VSTIAVWFSCGAPSAVAAKLTLDRFPHQNVVVLNTPIEEEDADNRRFLRDVAAWLGVEIVSVVSKKYPRSSAAEVWERERYMSGPYGAKCTVELKKNARYEYEREHKIDWHVLGFTADEIHRHKRFVSQERDNVIPILIDAGFTKQQCADFLISQGLKLPAMYERGYPSANCEGCIKVTSPTYWNHVRVDRPPVFQARCQQSRKLGVRLVQIAGGERIFLDELDPSLRGRPLKSLKFDCGIFCDMDEGTETLNQEAIP
jgi:3'-phosphoadenosine 5'-phosphosulfate sulfotransferase (PAPS reductase)/FAD synthetase